MHNTLSLVFSIVLAAATIVVPKTSLATDSVNVDMGSLVTKYCNGPQNQRQCDKMMRFASREKVKKRYEDTNSKYCDEGGDTTTDQAACRRIFKKKIANGCITEVFVRDFLFQGTPEEFYRKKEHERTYDYHPACVSDPEVLVGFCKCGCFDKSVNILAAERSNGPEVWTPIANLTTQSENYSLLSTNKDFEVGVFPERKYHDEYASLFGSQKEKKMVLIVTESGKKIKLTHDHPIIDSNEQILSASEVKIGTILVDFQGNPDPVTEVLSKNEKLDVYNVGSQKPIANFTDHLIFANGLIVGDMAMQRLRSFEEKSKLARELPASNGESK